MSGKDVVPLFAFIEAVFPVSILPVQRFEPVRSDRVFHERMSSNINRPIFAVPL